MCTNTSPMCRYFGVSIDRPADVKTINVRDSSRRLRSRRVDGYRTCVAGLLGQLKMLTNCEVMRGSCQQSKPGVSAGLFYVSERKEVAIHLITLESPLEHPAEVGLGAVVLGVGAELALVVDVHRQGLVLGKGQTGFHECSVAVNRSAHDLEGVTAQGKTHP